jgi:mRNA-degrading endonuclease RelE of RelBE toxin-antitoxin system
MKWGTRYHPDAIAAIYRIERGTAALVTEAIRQLGRNPRPPDSQELSDRANTYSIEPAGHLVIYELLESERIVHVMFIG